LFTPLLIAGCGSIYYSPQTTSLATLRITNASKLGPAGAGIYDNPYCIGGKAVSFNAVRSGQFTEIKIDAGHPITFVVDGDRGSDIQITVGPTLQSGMSLVKADIKRCQAPGRFTPGIGGIYEIVYTDDGKQCNVEVFDTLRASRSNVAFEQLVWGRASAANPKANCAP
jgi:hypothetical protein